MMSWSPTDRRNGVSGVAKLFRREDWRKSGHGAALEQVMRSALEDGDRVNRLHAAQVVGLLEPDLRRELALIRRHLLIEPEPVVAAVLTGELAIIARCLPDEVDAIVAELTESSLWQGRLALHAAGDLDLDTFISLVLWLAIAHESPVATSLARGWFSRPTEYPVTPQAISMIRPWLALAPARAEERRRAFAFIRTTAETLASARLEIQPSDAKEIYQIADTVIAEIYFASGASGTEDNDREPLPAEDGFADEAFTVLALLTDFKHPSPVHHAVQTLGHLSPADPRRAFLLVESCIRAGDAYTYDTLAADATVALIERYLAEYRDVVTTDPDLLTAVRRVLDAFVQVGWPAAISLSYRLGDAFR